eukprot:m.250733 g.250733  ORF g.250733 m.250733 type:complete len:178 (-) comp84149_c0_seq1:8-541(-)
MLSIRTAELSERQMVQDFHIPLHLALFADTRELEQQTNDIAQDFPSLLDDVSFAAGTHFLAFAQETTGDEERDGRLVLAGVAGVTPNVRPELRMLEYLSVSPLARKRGIGAALLQAALTHCKSQGTVRELRLYTVAGRMDAALRLYTRSGFRILSSSTYTANTCDEHARSVIMTYEM